MNKRILGITAGIGLFAFAPSGLANELHNRALSMFSAVPKYPPVIDGNELTQSKVELGKMLFFEPRISSSHLISCNVSVHSTT